MATVCSSKFSVNTLLSTSPTSSESRFPVRVDTVRVDTCPPYLRENRSAEGKVATRGIFIVVQTPSDHECQGSCEAELRFD